MMKFRDKAGALPAVMLSALALGFTAPAHAEALASAWVEGYNNKARLVAGNAGEEKETAPFAGIEIAMPAGWKTYWRSPGESGVPPEFDFSQSENLAEAKVFYPAPHRLIDKGGANIGYKEHVLFPVKLTANDPKQPVTLKLKAAYGVCKELCVPAEVELSVVVPPGAAPSAEIAEAVKAVPRLATEAGRDPKLSAWRLEEKGGKPTLVLEVADPGLSGGDAFVDAAGGVYIPLPKKISEAAGQARYEVDLTDGVDVKDLKGKPLAVTLTGAKGQSETAITLP